MDRRRFLKTAAGLFVPAIPAIIRPDKALAQLSGGVGGFPGPGTVHSTSGATAAFDQKFEKSWSGTGADQSWLHTPIGTPTGLIVGISNFDAVAPTLTDVRYNGVSMGAAAITQTVYGGQGRFFIFGMANPPAGAQTVLIDLAGANSFGFAFSMSVTGSDLATIFRGSNPATATSAAISNTISSAAGDLVVDFATPATSSRVISSPGAGQTGTVVAGRTDSGFSYKTATGASETMTWALNISDQWWSNAVSVKHA